MSRVRGAVISDMKYIDSCTTKKHDTLSMKRELERRSFKSEEHIKAALAELARATYHDSVLSGKQEEKYTPVMIASFSRRKGLQITEVGRRSR